VRTFALRWGPAIGVMAVIFALSSQPGLRISDDPGVDLPFRHGAHVAVYGLLSVCLVRGICWQQGGRPRPRDLAVAVALATLYGVSDEIHQAFVPNRTGHAIDVGWDLIGATIGAVVARVLSPGLLRWPADPVQRVRDRDPGPHAS
jgi:VanZ family protein